ncbi:class I SAM-dependent methyltransferase [Roseimaritima sediminicola]|uniref:class I SAM-dependent methyltransferase n=1 Tax=Roseimaritima sediminicola TaxID=2662066 RepID=UPI0012984A85|nr:class I SAM-dependent methyltransferase [Roseimaritima sediminicola]
MTAQDRSLQQYHQLLQLNAASHLLRIARQCGLLDELAGGQKTAEQLIEALQLRPEPARHLLAALRATGAIERYGDDYALAQVTRLLCQYDADLGDQMWQRFGESLREEVPVDAQQYRDSLAATQWTHTRSAMEAAEMLNIGEDRPGPRILDLGCGSAVWSCAMAYRDSSSRVTAVDNAAALAAATSTAQSIELGDRFDSIEGDPHEVDLPAGQFDLVILAQQLHGESPDRGARLLQQAQDALADTGEIVVIDLFQTNADPGAAVKLAEALEAVKLELCTESGAVRSPQQTEQQLHRNGFRSAQFSYLPSSHINLGMVVARKT